MRDIVRQAGVALALVTYYFGTKESLFGAVIMRRLGVVEAGRREAYDALIASGEVTVEGVIEAFISPYVRLLSSGDPGWINYARLIGRLDTRERWRPIIAELNATAERFLSVLARALPGVPRVRLIRGFVFSMKLMISTLPENQRFEELAGGLVAGNDLNAAYRDLVAYAAGGLRALANQPGQQRRRPAVGRSKGNAATERRRRPSERGKRTELRP
jgi:AcrR family transcriptional regulator